MRLRHSQRRRIHAAKIRNYCQNLALSHNNINQRVINFARAQYVVMHTQQIHLSPGNKRKGHPSGEMDRRRSSLHLTHIYGAPNEASQAQYSNLF